MRSLLQPRISLREATPEDAAYLAAIHRGAFRHAWTDGDFASFLSQRGVSALIAFHTGRFGSTAPAGFVLFRQAADDSEIITIAVRSAYRRRGVARKLMEEAIRRLYHDRAAALHLEVEAGNAPAVNLYRRLGFAEVGTRPAYYTGDDQARLPALVMRRQLL
ncbi:GNAT family N-acetyltransferase [Afifella sp. IM 167]|uniref:GNAT family N-acetyltransferase n=1 Tax=Afifella sp. IM 167 TaxID=2033586 RepID=UPI001CCE7597|nr:GNAT family N-acetyltransferase [Afifella sp. IM 167]MBZ8133724.1 ribosomal-protein-alanine N-acetyltransferase [Afifella sp. IM 167]